MTNIDTPEIRNLFGEYSIKSYSNKNNFLRKNTPGKSELIITNYDNSEKKTRSVK